MLEQNDNIYTLKEQEVSIKKVFNCFFEINSNIIYVTDKTNKFIGIITSGEFLKRLKNGESDVFINKQCSVIRLIENKEKIFAQSKELFNKYKITTAIPVLDENEKICFEIREKKDIIDKNVIKNFYGKIEQYEKSYYLKEETKLLHKLLKDQNIIVIGTKLQFEAIFGKLFQSRNRIIFFEKIYDAYEFFYNNTNLVIDVSITFQYGRRDIYEICNNGYAWQKFFEIVKETIESESCSRYYRVINNEVITLKECIEKYSDKRIIFSAREIFTSDLKEYLRKNHVDVIEQKGICRELFPKCKFKANGKISKCIANLNSIINMTDVALQFFYLNEELYNQVHVLNFAFDSEAKTTDLENRRIEEGFNFEEYISDIEKKKIKKSLYSEEHTQVKYLKELEKSMNFGAIRRFENDLIVLKDWKSNLINIENGMRKTSYQPNEYNGTIYFLGMCTIYGNFVEDCYTIPSIVQKYINKLNKTYRVVNLGNSTPINYSRLKDVLNIEETDIIILFFPVITEKIKNNISIIEIGEYFNKLRDSKYKDKECFLDLIAHCGDNGNIIYSEIIYNELKHYLIKVDKKIYKKNNLYNIFQKNEIDLKILYDWDNYTIELKKMKRVIPENIKKFGCVVMNCNPFSLGHRYLIEYALKKVEYLFIFVVEEDRSFFSFEDRYEMVKKGTCDLKNISIIRSGKLIISNEIFPAYFQKQTIVNQKNILVTEDLRVFAQYIAPMLNIQYRFVGEEPDDYVTCQYNNTMKKILPQFGIQVIEISRKFVDGEIISASKVRKYYKSGEFSKIRKLVPKTTLSYILSKNSLLIK